MINRHSIKSVKKHTAFIIPFVILVMSSCSNNKNDWLSMEGSVWNTTYNIKYFSSENLNDSILNCFRKIDAALSPFNPESIVSQINENKNYHINNIFRTVFETSKQLSSLTEGYFDPSIGQLINIWGFGPVKKMTNGIPDSSTINEALKSVGILDCQLNADTIIKKSPLTEFNFSAITKGFACDYIASMFRRHNISNYLIEIGGEIYVNGKNPRNRSWVIQIDAPIVNDRKVLHNNLTKIAIEKGGLATSGNYRNYRVVGSDSIGHTINPMTGLPVRSDLISATVIANTAMTADAIATALMAMPVSLAIQTIASIPEIETLIVLAKDTEYTLPEDLSLIKGQRWEMVKTPGFPDFIN